MKKSTKGALAAGGAAVLLLGGAGSLAYWTAGASVNASSFTTGTMKLTAGTCSGWTYASGSASGSAVNLIVPGDSITSTCTYTVAGTGDHLSAHLASAPSTVALTPAATGSYNATVATSYTLGGTALANPTTAGSVAFPAANGKELDVVYTVTFPYGDATTKNISADSQSVTEALSALTVTLVQDQATGNNPNA